jgi:hypothetical protein
MMDARKMGRTSQCCPICRTVVAPSARYPRYVCVDCVERTQSVRGRSVSYGVEVPFGPLVGRYVVTRRRYAQDECFIDGVRCRVSEAHFGGVVIEPTQPARFMTKRY